MQLAPIPVSDLSLSTSDMGRATYLQNHPLAKEPLVNLEDFGIACQPFTEREIIVSRTTPPLKTTHMTQGVWCRKTPAEMLQQANAAVRSHGLSLYVKDAYRPLGVQQDYWDYFINLAKERTGSADMAVLVKDAEKFCSNPTRFDAQNPATWPLHITGGAIDLTLVDKATGKELLMEPQNSGYGNISHTHHAELMLEETPSAEWTEIAKNRRILYYAMLHAGFTNYPHEWWHYDFGTPMYGLLTNPQQPEFFYGYIDLQKSL